MHPRDLVLTEKVGLGDAIGRLLAIVGASGPVLVSVLAVLCLIGVIYAAASRPAPPVDPLAGAQPFGPGYRVERRVDEMSEGTYVRTVTATPITPGAFQLDLATRDAIVAPSERLSTGYPAASLQPPFPFENEMMSSKRRSAWPE